MPPTRIKREFNVSAQIVTHALLNMGFREVNRSSLTVRHYRRNYGLHVVVTKRKKKKKQEVRWEDQTRITTIRVHKDSLKHDQVIPFDKPKFLNELKQEIANLVDKQHLTNFEK